MNIPGNISATAFVASYGRARRRSVSQDLYSHLWQVPGIEELWQDYATAVYPHDDLELSLRCRFFLERIQSFGEGHREPVFINIASGFTSYPFLIQPHYISAECDYGHIIEFKQGQLSQWQQAGILPERDVRYFPADLNSPESLQLLLERMQAISQGRPSFILMEGITYYWEAARLHEFLGALATMQASGSVLAFDFWRPSIQQHPVFRRLTKYLTERFGFAAHTHTFIDETFIQSIAGYQAWEITEVTEQERVYCRSSLLRGSGDVLEENYAILRRI